MTQENDCAFTGVDSIDGFAFYHKGLTKREYFAAMAMHAISCIENSGERYTVNGGYLHHESIAIDAVSLADALINQLNKQP
jgi:hypothetical protein